MSVDLEGYEFDKGSQPKPVRPERLTKLDITDERLSAATLSVLGEIARERVYQDEVWGGPEHDDTHTVRDWVTFIVAYLGKAVNRDSEWARNLSISRIALVKVAALCVAALESFDRKIARDGL